MLPKPRVTSVERSAGGGGSPNWLPVVTTQVFHVPASGSTGCAETLLAMKHETCRNQKPSRPPLCLALRCFHDDLKLFRVLCMPAVAPVGDAIARSTRIAITVLEKTLGSLTLGIRVLSGEIERSRIDRVVKNFGIKIVPGL
jgi:hypothetical protein